MAILKIRLAFNVEIGGNLSVVDLAPKHVGLHNGLCTLTHIRIGRWRRYNTSPPCSCHGDRWERLVVEMTEIFVREKTPRSAS